MRRRLSPRLWLGLILAGIGLVPIQTLVLCTDREGRVHAESVFEHHADRTRGEQAHEGAHAGCEHEHHPTHGPGHLVGHDHGCSDDWIPLAPSRGGSPLAAPIARVISAVVPATPRALLSQRPLATGELPPPAEYHHRTVVMLT